MREYLKERYRWGVLIIILILSVTSCEKKETSPDYAYVVHYEKVFSYEQSQIELILALGAIQYQEIDSLNLEVLFDVDVYKITYRTQFNGNSIEASGLVCFPVGKQDFPVISFQNGTNTCHSNAPSERLDNQLYSFISIMATGGYIIAIPDYIGFGVSSEILHPYMHRESTNAAVIDLMHAVIEITETKNVSATYNGNVFLMGYSQGGWASLSVLNALESNPDDRLNVLAAACGAGAYDLESMAEYILSQEEYPTTFYMPYFLESRIINNIFPDSLSTYFKEPVATNIPDLFAGELCNNELNAEFPLKVNELMQDDLINKFSDGISYKSLRTELNKNSVNAWSVNAKLRFYHSSGDQSIPYFQTSNIAAFFHTYGLSGDQLSSVLVMNDTLDHNDVIISWGIDAINWLTTINN